MKIISDFEQGSVEWLKARCGKITMSNAKALLTGGKGRTRQSYIYDVLSERLSGEPIEGFKSIDMERGNFLEPYALQAFSKMTGLKVQRVAMVLADDERIACSPDALAGSDAVVEVKCPRPRQHIRNMFADGIEDYRQQAQGNMMVTKRERCFIVSFCPWVTFKPLYIKLINHDRDLIQRLQVSATDAADTVDSLEEVVQAATSPEEVLKLARGAMESWENVLTEESEVIT